jgi:hypothetical protein
VVGNPRHGASCLSGTGGGNDRPPPRQRARLVRCARMPAAPP